MSCGEHAAERCVSENVAYVVATVRMARFLYGKQLCITGFGLPMRCVGDPVPNSQDAIYPYPAEEADGM